MHIPQIILASANGNGEETFWISILIIVLLSSGIGVWSLARKKTNENILPEEAAEHPPTAHSQQGLNWHKKTDFQTEPSAEQSTAAQTQSGQIPILTLPKGNVSGRHYRRPADVQSGLELLEPPFLTGMVSDIESRHKLDIQMRKIAFVELSRRGQLGSIEGGVLKVYAKNQENLFGKTIQCEALKELAGRTRSEKYAMAVIG